VIIKPAQSAIIAALDRELERLGDDTQALSREAQAARLAELQSALLHLQRQEEAVIEQLGAQGQMLQRVCNNPKVLLGIERTRP
jgi:hypothetical protein